MEFKAYLYTYLAVKVVAKLILRNCWDLVNSCWVGLGGSDYWSSLSSVIVPRFVIELCKLDLISVVFLCPNHIKNQTKLQATTCPSWIENRPLIVFTLNCTRIYLFSFFFVLHSETFYFKTIFFCPLYLKNITS